MQCKITQLHLRAQCSRRLLLRGTQHVSVESCTMKQHDHPHHQQNNQKREAARDPGGDSLPAPPRRHTQWFTRRLMIEWWYRQRAQNACPSVTKNWVDLIPGKRFRLWPTSNRIAPTGVAKRSP